MCECDFWEVARGVQRLVDVTGRVKRVGLHG